MEQRARAEIVALLPRLRRFTRGLTGGAEAGDELLQATCERALTNLHQWQPGSRLDSWLFRIARNLFLNEIRANKVRRGYLRDAVEMMPGAEQGQRVAEERIAVTRLRGFLARLPEEQRSVLLLVCVEGQSYAEAANTLELPIGTVTSRLARARLTLKDWMEAGSGKSRPSPVRSEGAAPGPDSMKGEG